MQQERKTLDELSTSQATEFLRLDTEEAACLCQASEVLAPKAEMIAEYFLQQVKALPGAPKLLNAVERHPWKVRDSVCRWVEYACKPWDRARSDAYVRRLAAMYARAGVPATYISASIACLGVLCTKALVEALAGLGDTKRFQLIVAAFQKRLAMDELGLLGWHFRHLRNSLRAQKTALEAMVQSRSATLRSTVAFSTAVADELDEEQVVRILADHVMRNFKPEGLIIHVIESGDVVVPAITVMKGRISAPPENICERALRNDWQLCRVARTGRGFHIADVANSLVKCPHQELPLNEGSYCCVPLAGGIRVHGWMHITKAVANAFTDEELEVLSIYGQMVGAAITSLRLVRENRFQATTDALTGLHNRRHFEAVLAKEDMLLKRRGGSGSILMIDVDKFKGFNDRYGHDAGDRILKALATALAQNVRATDEVARLGGDEFVALLRDASASDAMAVAQKVSQAAAAVQVRLNATTTASLKISIGVAGCPKHAETLTTTMQLADMALLDSKELGGNQATVFKPEGSSAKEHALAASPAGQ